MANISLGLPQSSTLMLPLFPQCVQTHVNTPLVYQFSTPFTRANAQNISQLNTTITPRTPTSRVLITVSMSYEVASVTTSIDSPQAGAFYLVRRVGGVATEIGSPVGPFGARPYGLGGFDYDSNIGNNATTMANYGRSFLDTPNTTSSVTYELWAYSTNTVSVYLTVNRNRTNDNNYYNPLVTSQMLLQEFFV